MLEAHTDDITSLSCSSDTSILASASSDGHIKLWHNTTTWPIKLISELTSIGASALFHPHIPQLATFGETTVVRIWDIDVDVLLNNAPAVESTHYTTAKVVLVGDSGVGKTGLGWRMAKGEFKEHASTHGQQFWVVGELGKTRADGTQCEAVLWDLAGQHVYRPIHSIFLDDVDTALVLFDPSNRPDPLKGAQFWLEQLRGKGQLPPAILVGARTDRGAPAVSRAELERFCRQYGVSGGYVGTSALSGEGLPELLETLKAQIPWEHMTTTVTTVTFKRIKEFVLALKERPDRSGVLVGPAELRARLEASDPEWRFSDAELLTAVGHLQNHGYVAVLAGSDGERHILLAPELLASLAASVVLQADRHPRELGAVNETELLQGRYPLEELRGLDQAEQQVLLDAAVQRFLAHTICFRETLDDDTLLIFPGLIKQKRPLDDDAPTTDDVSYIVRGRVENIYPMLVVLLGYTPSFTRINQWQSQAQYELGPGQICGFRMFEEREGEIELGLYYGDQLPQRGRELFLELFERFLYQREVEVTRVPPVLCPQGHRQKRATVVERARAGKSFTFCDECGGRAELPALGRPELGLDGDPWLLREEAAARLQSLYEAHLVRVKGYRRSWAAPRCYLSGLPGQGDLARRLAHDLLNAGVLLLDGPGQVGPDDHVVILDTPAYRAAWKAETHELGGDLGLIKARLALEPGRRRLHRVTLTSAAGPQPPHVLRDCKRDDFCDAGHYPVSLLNLVLALYAIPHDHAAFLPLRQSLHEQWERMPREPEAKPAAAASAAEAKPASPREEARAPGERYLDFALQITPEGHATARSHEGETSARVALQPPDDILLALTLIEQGVTDAALYRRVGQALYGWLFPGPIHTHLHQSEATARATGAKLRLRLQVEAPSIGRLPLELLYREAGAYFMATNPGTVLSRYLSLPLPPGRARRRDDPLHMLVIVASPAGLPTLDPDEWETTVTSALTKPIAEGRLSVRTVKRATRKAIRDALLAQGPDIVQFVGHGFYEEGRGRLALVDDDTGGPWALDEERFASLFAGHADGLGLVCLATCESARSDDTQGFVGIAPQLVRRCGVPAVVAMQYRLRADAAKIFLEEFYSSVAARKPVDWAAQAARNAVALELGQDNREFATPVLFMRAADGNVF